MKNIKIKRFDKNLPLPQYQSPGAAGFDLMARKTVIIGPNMVGYIPLNIAVKTPRDHFLMIVPRSSTHRLGILQINSIAIGDSDFCGDDDEYKMPAFNFTNKQVKIERGARIAQGLFIKFAKADWHEVQKMKSKTRGGFGSTGRK